MELTSIHIGSAAPLVVGGRTVSTAIAKHPVAEAVITQLGLEGNTIANREHHGGPDQAVYVYGADDYAWWAGEGGVDLPAGSFGENLTISALSQDTARIGDRIAIGADVVLEIAAPRIPCSVLAAHIGESDFRQRFQASRRPGAYCRVIATGAVAVGDPVDYQQAPTENVPMLEIFDLYYDRSADPTRLEAALRSPVAIRARDDITNRLERAHR